MFDKTMAKLRYHDNMLWDSCAQLYNVQRQLCQRDSWCVCFPITQNFQVFLMVLSKTIRIIFIIKLFGSSHFFLLNLYNYNDVRFWLSTTMPFDCQTLSRGNQMAQLLERAQSNSVACTMKILFYIFHVFLFQTRHCLNRFM